MLGRLMSLGMVAWLAAGNASAAVPEAPKLPIESYSLPNGLKVVLHRDTSVPTVAVCVAYHVGSKDERAGRTGFAHFFEHMMFRGTKNVPNYDIPLQEAGSTSNAFTSEDITLYHETVPSSYLERTLYLEAERLAFLPQALDQDKFDTEREVVKNERRQGIENVPYGMAEEASLGALYPKGHPYSWSVIGSMADLNAATLDDLRRFFAEYYHVGNATLTLSGSFDPAQARTWISTFFGPLRRGPVPRRPERTTVPSVDTKVELADDVTFPRLEFYWPTVADDHPDTPALDVLASILGDGDTSRLNKALVRESQIATSVSAQNETREIAGQFVIRATAAKGVMVEQLQAAIDRVLDGIRANPPRADEIERFRARYEMDLYKQLTSLLARGVTFSIGSALHDDPAHYREEFARTMRVEAADVQRVARKYLTPQRLTLVIRPRKPDEPKTIPPAMGPLAETGAVERTLPHQSPEAGPDWSKMPGPSAAPAWEPPAFIRTATKGGPQVLRARWSSLPLVSLAVIVPAGSARDSVDRSGLAQLVGRLSDQGTRDLNAIQLAEAFELLGTQPTVSVDEDFATIGLTVTTSRLTQAVELLGTMLGRPRFDSADLDRERKLQLARLERGPDSPTWIASRALPVLVYGERHPYGLPTDGRPNGVQAITRAEITAFHDRWYRPDLARILVVGDIDMESGTDWLTQALTPWTTKAKESVPVVPQAERNPTDVVYLIDKPGAAQSVIRVGRIWTGRRDPAFFPTLLGDYTLGGDFLSRLNQNLREKNGFSYGAGTMVDYRASGSLWMAATDVRTDATGPALKEVLGELDGIRSTRSLTEEDVSTAKQAISKTFPEGFEDPGSILQRLRSIAVFDLPDNTWRTYLDDLAKPTREDVQKTMSTLLDPSVRIVLIVGDRKAIEPGLKAAGFDQFLVLSTDGAPIP